VETDIELLPTIEDTLQFVVISLLFTPKKPWSYFTRSFLVISKHFACKNAVRSPVADMDLLNHFFAGAEKALGSTSLINNGLLGTTLWSI
jgi:hypothetical protein